jgi:hypothetical protein
MCWDDLLFINASILRTVANGEAASPKVLSDEISIKLFNLPIEDQSPARDSRYRFRQWSL